MKRRYTLLTAWGILYWAISAMAGSSPGFNALNMACSFTLTPGPDVTICNPGQSVNIGATVTGQYLSAVWTPSTGLSNPNALNTSATVSQTTTYTLTVSGLSASNLITNGDFNAGLTGFTSDYVQGTGGSFGLLSAEGTFAVSTNANLTHNNFVNCTDHTGGGNMLVVNGAGTPNQDVWCQTVAVSPGTNYAFSLWGATVVPSSPAILQFSINGNLLGSSFSLPTATCQWTQHFQLWNSGGASSATICIVNQNTQTSGNDFALDDIVFGPVCEETTQVTVTVIDVDATWTPPQGLCPLSPGFPLNSLLSPTATPGGAWTINGSPATFFNPALLGPGTFSVSYTVGTAPCIETVTLPIVVNTLPSADWLTPGLMCVGMPAVLLNNLLLPGALPGGSWTINGSPAFVFNPSVWGPGSHTVIYETGTPPCTNSLAQIIQVQAQPIADWTPPPPLCINSAAFPLNTLLPPGTTPGGTWLIGGNNALVFNPAVQGAGQFSVTYQVGTFPCNASQTHFIEVLALANAQWDGPDTLCRTAPIVMLNTWLLPGTATGGSWTLDGQAATQLNPALLSPGLHTLVYTVGPANCQRSASGTVRIQDTLIAPEPFCSIVTGNSVEIQWPGMPGQSYTVQVLSGPAPSFVNNTSAQFTGLAVGASVSVILQASAAGPCPPVFSDTLTCTTFSCDALPVHIQPVDTLCLYPGAPAITLTATLPDTAAQGIPAWSGPGITNAVTGQFSPTVAGAGTHTIYFFYNLDNCVGTDSIEIVVVQRPTAMFSVAPIVCIADTTVVTFTGMAGPSATYLWDFDDAQVLYGSGPGPIGLLWDSYGQHLISLTVEESGCVSLPYFRPVNISAVVDTPQVFCNAALTEIELVWNSLPDGNSVIVYVLDGPLGTPTSDTSYLITGLMPGQQVTVRMSAGTESACDEVIIIVQCDALPCTGLAVDIAQPDTVCLPAGPLDLDAVVTGGGSQGQLVWSGPGITDTLAGTWQPNAGMIGQLVPVTATFTEGPCSAADTVWIAVSKTPTSDISADSVVCVADMATVQYLGNAGAGAVFNWNFGGATAVSGNGAGPQSLSFASAGNYTVTLSVEENGCAGAPDTALIQVDALLQTPVVQCEATYTSVTFSWASQANAAQHSVLNLSGNGGAMQGDTAFVVTGLMPGQTVNIELTAHSANACPGATAAASCTTLPCPDVQIDVAALPAVCWDGQADTITLSAQLSGAPATGVLHWEGEGVADTALGLWVSAANMAGRSITVYAVFTDDVCVFRDSASIAVWPVPTSDISADSVVCVADMATVQYLGNAGAGAVFNWNFGGATAVPGNGAGPQSLSFASPGNYMITLSVEENGCAGAPDTALIQVDALLQMPVVQCEATYTSVIFSWASQANAAQHSVLNLSGNGGAMQGDTAFVVTGLMPGQTVNIELTAHSANACPDATAAASCTTLPCPDVQIDIAPVPAVCWDGQADTITLSAQLSGAPATGVLRWEGEGVADTALGTWVSAANMAGRSITVYAVFTDDVCVFRDSASIAVWPVPTSDISADSVVCVADMATVQYLGNAGAGAVFNWNFGGATAVPGNGAGPQSLSFASAGSYIVTLSVEENGCAGAPDTALIQVDALLQTPVVQCEATYTGVVFSWTSQANAAQHSVLNLSGNGGAMQGDTAFVVTGLMPGQTVKIELTAHSANACPDATAAATCTTLPCPDVQIDIAPVPAVCWDGQADTITLSAQLSGAPATGVLRWEGEGVADTALGTWVSVANMAGRSITVYAVFTDDVCVFRDSASIAVWPVPSSDISADSVLCVADLATVQYLGNAGADAVFNWNFGGATAVPGNGAGPQSLSFASPGNYMITLSVEENGCAGAPDTALIQVDALLQMPVVQCETTYTSVVFSWPAIVGATAYQVILPAGIIPVWTSDTSIIISNLAPGTTLPISVEAVSETACPNTSAQSSCTTLPCPPVSLTMTATPVVCIGDSAQVQFSLAGPAGTLLDLVLSDGVQTWPLAGVGHGRIFRFLPAQSLVINVISTANAALPACPVNLPAPVQVQVEALREAGTPIMGAPVCAFTDTLVNLNQLLMGADGGGQWSLFPGSAQPFAGSFQAGAGSFRVTPNDAGSFRFRYIVAAGAACPADTAVASLELLPLPPANAGPDQTLDCLHRVVSIGRAGNAAFRYLWTSADGRLIDDDMPIVEADAPGLYRLEVLNPLTGCRAFDEMRVISEIAVLEPQTGVGQISCYGADDGWIQVQAVGQATPPLQFSLNGAPPVPQGLFPRLSPGLYELLIRDAAGCETTLRFDLQQPSELQAVIDAPGLAGDPPSIQLGDSLRLELLTNVPPAEVASIVWSPAPCPECMSVSLRPSFTDTYAVTVTNQNGCSASAELTVLVDRRPAVFIPNAFSPNNDGFNDRLLVFAGKQVSHVRSFLIFDRWGEAVYEVYQFPPNDPAYGWDGSYRGQPLQSAVFVYVAEVETIDGEVHLLKGDVTLVR